MFPFSFGKTNNLKKLFSDMKKHLFLLIISMVAFAACSKDDGEKSGPSVKKVVDFSDLEYDSQGRLIKSREYPEIVYGTDEIRVRVNNDGVYYYFTFYLNADGLVDSYKANYNDFDTGAELIPETPLKYDETGHLIASGNDTYTWSDGNIVKIRRTPGTLRDIVFKYSQEEYKGNIAEYIGNPTFGYGETTWCSFLVDYGYFGKRCKNLCVQIDDFLADTETPTEGSSQDKYEYTFDESGYVTRVVKTYMHYSNGYQGRPRSTTIKYKEVPVL